MAGATAPVRTCSSAAGHRRRVLPRACGSDRAPPRPPARPGATATERRTRPCRTAGRPAARPPGRWGCSAAPRPARRGSRGSRPGGRRLEGDSDGPPSSARTPRLSNSELMPAPLDTATAPHTGGAVATSRARERSTWARMSATSRCETAPCAANTAVTASGSSVWMCTLSVVWSPTISSESPSRSSAGANAPLLEIGAGDREARAVAIRRRSVLGMGDARGRVVLERRPGRRLAARPTMPATNTVSA